MNKITSSVDINNLWKSVDTASFYKTIKIYEKFLAFLSKYTERVFMKL